MIQQALGSNGKAFKRECTRLRIILGVEPLARALCRQCGALHQRTSTSSQHMYKYGAADERRPPFEIRPTDPTVAAERARLH